MALLKALEEPREIVTRDGKIKVTHEAFCFTIVPYAFPPIQVKSVKGHIDRMGRFKPILPMEASFDLSQEEFRELISPNPQGKPAGDFRISDIMTLWRKRHAPPRTEAPAQPKEAVPETKAATAAQPEAEGPAKGL